MVFFHILPVLLCQMMCSWKFFNGFAVYETYKVAFVVMSILPNSSIVDCEHCDNFGAGFYFKYHENLDTEVVVKLITGNL